MRKVAIVGIGQLPMKERYVDKIYTELAFEATRLALKDAQLTVGDIDSAVYSVYNETMQVDRMSDATIHDYLGLEGKSHMRIVAGASTEGHAIKAAFAEVASGCSDVVLVLGVQKGSDMIDLELMHRGEGFWQLAQGSAILKSPYLAGGAEEFTLVLTGHMARYGGPTEEQIARVAVKNHLNALDNPYAQLKLRLTVEDVLNSRLISWPTTMLECCLYSECASALILASEEKAASIAKKPIWVSGVASTCGYASHQDGDLPALARAGQLAYSMAGIKDPLKQLDLMEVHDIISGYEIMYYEALGLCAAGEGGRLVDEGVTEKTGKLPVNRSGGRTAAGHVAGVSGIYSACEVVRQLREEAGPRQVPIRNGRGLILTAGGPVLNYTAVAILER